MSQYKRPKKQHAVVADIGSCYVRYGFAADDTPRVTFPSVMGTCRFHDNNTMTGIFVPPRYEGDLAVDKMALFNIDRPIFNALRESNIKKEEYERLLRYGLNYGLRVGGEDQPFFGILPNQNSELRRLTNEIMFELFDAPAVYIDQTGLLSLYASGRLDGIVLDVGYGLTKMASRYNNTKISTETMSIGGYDCLTILRAFTEFNSTESELYLLQKMFENSSFLKLMPAKINSRQGFDYSSAPKESLDNIINRYNLPDGTEIRLTPVQKYVPPEILFQPKAFGFNLIGITDFLINHMRREEISPVNKIADVVLAGGGTCINRLPERLLNETLAQCNSDAFLPHINIISPNQRKLSNWIGASLISEWSSFNEYWFSRDQYDEFGPDFIFNQKPFNYY